MYAFVVLCNSKLIGLKLRHASICQGCLQSLFRMGGWAFTLDQTKQLIVRHEKCNQVIGLFAMDGTHIKGKSAIDHLHGDSGEWYGQRFGDLVGEIN